MYNAGYTDYKLNITLWFFFTLSVYVLKVATQYWYFIKKINYPTFSWNKFGLPNLFLFNTTPCHK